MPREADIGGRDLAIIISGSYGNAVTLVAAEADQIADLDIYDVADAVKALADAITERKIESYGKFGVPNNDQTSGGGSGNAGSRKKSSSQRSTGKGSARRGSSPRKRSGGNGPSKAQVKFYGDLHDLLSENDIDVSSYPNPDDFADESFEDAKALIGELVELRDDNDLGF